MHSLELYFTDIETTHTYAVYPQECLRGSPYADLTFISVIGEPLTYEVNLCKETFDDHAGIYFSYTKVNVNIKPFVKGLFPLVKYGRHSVWCLDEDKIERNASQSGFEKGYLCYLPSQVITDKASFSELRPQQDDLKFKFDPKAKIEKGKEYVRPASIEIKVEIYDPEGHFLALLSVGNIEQASFNKPCTFSGASKNLPSNMPGEIEYYRKRPKLFHSFNFNSVASDGTSSPLSEKICIVQHDESVKEAAKRFSNEHKLGVKHEKYVEDELSKSIQYKQERRQVLRKIIKEKIRNGKKINVVFGASSQQTEEIIHYFDTSDWIPLTINDFDMLSEDDFRFFFDPESGFGTNSIEVIDAVMTEHVFEHLNVVDAIYALKLLTKYLKNDGYMRIVPDWNINGSNATSQKYMEDIRDKHYQQYNYQNLQSFFPNIFSTTV